MKQFFVYSFGYLKKGCKFNGMNWTTLWLGFILLSLVNALAQEPRFINFNTKDGLSQKHVYHTCQDHQGYIWAGTVTGLYRYDGHEFKYFSSPLDQPGHSISNLLNAICVDEHGYLWLGSYNTLQWYDPVVNRFWSPNLQDPTVLKLTQSGMLGIKPVEDERMFINTLNNYFFAFNIGDSSWHHFDQYPQHASKSTFNVFSFQNYLYAVHREGIYQFNQTGSLEQFFPWVNQDISNAYFDAGEKEVVLTTLRSALIIFNLVTKQYRESFFANQKLKGQQLFSVLKDQSGGYYIGAHSLFHAHPKNKSYTNFSSRSSAEFELSAIKIGSMFFDRENNLWLSGDGLSMLPWQNNQILSRPLVDPTIGYNIEPDDVFKVPGSPELIFTNTNSKGLIKYHLTDQTITLIHNPENNRPMTIGIQSPDGQLFFSDYNQLYQYDPRKNSLQVKPLYDQNKLLVLPHGKHTPGPQGEIIMQASRGGFYVWHYPGTKVEHRQVKDYFPEETLLQTDMAPVLTDSRGSVWFTSSHGAYQYWPGEKKMIAIGLTEPAFIGTSVEIVEDKQQHIWISTYSNGLYEYWDEGDTSYVWNHHKYSGSGLIGNYCTYLAIDPVDSMLWINNSGTLIKFNPYTRRIMTQVTKQNGLREDGSEYAFRITSDGHLIKLFFGGFGLINLNEYQKNLVLPTVNFNSIKVFNQDYVYARPKISSPIKLPHTSNYLQFDYTALVLNNSNRNQYAHYLEGLEHEWIYTNAEHNTSYAGLKPGQYTFKVKAANSDGYWGAEKAVKFIIIPPFYATWWFISLVIILLSGSIYFINRYLVRQARKEEKIKAEFNKLLAETEMKALRAQMNPHFIFNALNSIQKYILKEEHEQASIYLTKFSKLIRLILDHSNQNTIKLNSELELLKLYLEIESLRFEQQFTYAIHVDKGINQDTEEVPSMLIQPFVENAIWHGLLHKNSPGHLQLNFTHHEQYLVIEIDDDGVGRLKAEEFKNKLINKNKSYGMQLAQKRISILNRLQNLQANSEIIDKVSPHGEALGTTVVIRIPFK